MAFSGGAHELRREFTAGRDSELPKRTGTSASDAINGTLRVLGVGIIVASAR